MAAYFFDSSAIVKRYVQEAGTIWVSGITDPNVGNTIEVARITGVEVVSALCRQARSGNLTPSALSIALTDFLRDFAQQYLLTAITPRLLQRAMLLARTCALRGYDAVQLAAALQVNVRRLSRGRPTLTLVSTDAALNAAASAEGLPVENPDAYP